MGLQGEFEALKRSIARTLEDATHLEAGVAWLTPDGTARAALYTRVTLDGDSETFISPDSVPRALWALHLATFESAREFSRARVNGVLRVAKAIAL